MLNAYTVNTGSIYSEIGSAKSDQAEIRGKWHKEGKIGGIFDPCYAIRLFLPAGKVCLSD